MFRLPLRPPLREPLRDAFLRAGNISQAIRALFANNQQGAWYDPSDFSTLFQDSAGATAVTAVEQPVGLMRDKSGRNNHASQITAASRPVVSARVNLLTKSEQFDDAAWGKNAVLTVSANSVTAPDGTLTADTLTRNAAATVSYADLTQSITASGGNVGKTYTSSVWLWTNSGTLAASLVISDLNFNTYTQAITVTTTPTRFTFTSSGGAGWNVSGTQIAFGLNVAINSVFNAWGAQLDVGTATRYQRVNTASDYDTAGFPMYLRFDGVDDGMATAAINFSATDKMTVWAGAFRGGTTALGILAELAAGGALGSMYVAAPYSGTQRYAFVLTGTTTSAQSYDTLASPAALAEVTSCAFDIAGAAVNDEIKPRINGATGAVTNFVAGPAGTGNFGNHPLFIGRRNNASLPFTGNLYSLIIRGAASNAAEIAVTERYVANKTGVTL